MGVVGWSGPRNCGRRTVGLPCTDTFSFFFLTKKSRVVAGGCMCDCCCCCCCEFHFGEEGWKLTEHVAEPKPLSPLCVCLDVFPPAPPTLSSEAGTLSVFSLTAGFPLVHKYGFLGSGAGQFAFAEEGPSGGICFVPATNTLLVRPRTLSHAVAVSPLVSLHILHPHATMAHLLPFFPTLTHTRHALAVCHRGPHTLPHTPTHNRMHAHPCPCCLPMLSPRITPSSSPTHTLPTPIHSRTHAPLQVAEHGNNRVQEVDVMAQAHVGFLCKPGAVQGPRAVAASPTLVAVSAWTSPDSEDHVVHLFNATSRAHLRVMGGGGLLNCPFGLRIIRGTIPWSPPHPINQAQRR